MTFCYVLRDILLNLYLLEFCFETLSVVVCDIVLVDSVLVL